MNFIVATDSIVKYILCMNFQLSYPLGGMRV